MPISPYSATITKAATVMNSSKPAGCALGMRGDTLHWVDHRQAAASQGEMKAALSRMIINEAAQHREMTPALEQRLERLCEAGLSHVGQEGDGPMTEIPAALVNLGQALGSEQAHELLDNAISDEAALAILQAKLMRDGTLPSPQKRRAGLREDICAWLRQLGQSGTDVVAGLSPGQMAFAIVTSAASVAAGVLGTTRAPITSTFGPDMETFVSPEAMEYARLAEMGLCGLITASAVYFVTQKATTMYIQGSEVSTLSVLSRSPDAIAVIRKLQRRPERAVTPLFVQRVVREMWGMQRERSLVKGPKFAMDVADLQRAMRTQPECAAAALEAILGPIHEGLEGDANWMLAISLLMTLPLDALENACLRPEDAERLSEYAPKLMNFTAGRDPTAIDASLLDDPRFHDWWDKTSLLRLNATLRDEYERSPLARDPALADLSLVLKLEYFEFTKTQALPYEQVWPEHVPGLPQGEAGQAGEARAVLMHLPAEAQALASTDVAGPAQGSVASPGNEPVGRAHPLKHKNRKAKATPSSQAPLPVAEQRRRDTVRLNFHRWFVGKKKHHLPGRDQPKWLQRLCDPTMAGHKEAVEMQRDKRQANLGWTPDRELKLGKAHT